MPPTIFLAPLFFYIADVGYVKNLSGFMPGLFPAVNSMNMTGSGS